MYREVESDAAQLRVVGDEAVEVAYCACTVWAAHADQPPNHAPRAWSWTPAYISTFWGPSAVSAPRGTRYFKVSTDFYVPSTAAGSLLAN